MKNLTLYVILFFMLLIVTDSGMSAIGKCSIKRVNGDEILLVCSKTAGEFKDGQQVKVKTVHSKKEKLPSR